MGTIYEWTFFLALGLLAIVITVFVFAVSLLGRALETAAKSEKKKLAERREKNAKEMAAIRREIREAEHKGQIPKGLRRKLQKLEERDEKDEREIGKIRKAPKSLTVEGGVVPCGSCLLAAVILTSAAWYLSTIENLNLGYSVLTWILGLAAIGYTISRIYQCLKVIESVAITSEAEAERRLSTAVKLALKEVEEERKPKLELAWKDQKPPFHIKAKSTMLIEFNISLGKGDVARKPEVYFAAPPGFGFPGSPERLPPHGKEYANYVCTAIECLDIPKGLYLLREVKIKAPSEPKQYSLWYFLVCEEFAGNKEEFKVIVE